LVITVRGLQVHYESIGEGRPVVVLHGLGADHRFGIHRYEPVFAERPGWRRIYPDLPGMGQTAGAPWIRRPEDFVELLLDFVDAVAPGERFALVGISWGAYLALGMTRSIGQQLDGLMLTVPVIRGRGEDRDLPPRFVLRRAPGIDDLVDDDEIPWTKMAVVQTPETLAAFREAVKPGLLVADWAFLRTVAARFEESVTEDRLPVPLEAPALVLAGRHDVAVGFADAWPLMQDLQRGSYVALDAAGHGVEEEQRVLFRSLASEWLDRVEAWRPNQAST